MQWQHADGPPGADLAAALGTAMALYQNGSEAEGPEPDRQHAGPVARPDATNSDSQLDAGGRGAPDCRDAARAAPESVARNERPAGRTRRARAGVRPRHRAAAEPAGRRRTSCNSCKRSRKQLPQPDWQQILSRISQSMPEDVWLDRLTFHDGRSAALSGASYTDSGVYDFVGYLKQVPDIAEIALEGTGVGQSATGPTTNFNLQLTLANLAGRNERRSDMIEQTLRSFCESRHRWLIVIAGTFVVGLVLVMPLVDAYVPDVTKRRRCSRSWIRQDRSPRSFPRRKAALRKSLPSWKCLKREPSTTSRCRCCAASWSTWPRRRAATFAD